METQSCWSRGIGSGSTRRRLSIDMKRTRGLRRHLRKGERKRRRELRRKLRRRKLRRRRGLGRCCRLRQRLMTLISRMGRDGLRELLRRKNGNVDAKRLRQVLRKMMQEEMVKMRKGRIASGRGEMGRSKVSSGDRLRRDQRQIEKDCKIVREGPKRES